jgi:hypothetical protein
LVPWSCVPAFTSQIRSNLCVKKAIAEVQAVLALTGQALPTRATAPISNGYRPEADLTTLLPDRMANYYQGLIGVLRWMCELGRIDIQVEVSLLSRFLAAPRDGHPKQVYHIFAYLRNHERSALVMDDTLPSYEDERFAKCDAPKPRGKSVTMTCFVDADHAGCLVTRRSHTGVIIFVNCASILWYSKRQNTVELSTFGSEFIAAKTAVDMIKGLR